MTRPDPTPIDRTIRGLTEQLLARRTPSGHWEGRLASSALATATAVMALTVAGRRGAGAGGDAALVSAGLAWLSRHQNDDGGFGDTTLSVSNVSTTALCWSALSLGWSALSPGRSALPGDDRDAPVCATRDRAEGWMRHYVGDLDPASLRRVLLERYGADRTFSVPILTVLALAGKLGQGPDAWRLVPQLPFELAACPHRLFRWLRLPVVSYAMPALVAMGQVRHYRAATRTPLVGPLRSSLRVRTQAVARAMQPASGGYLEAVPLTAFVVMSLVEAGAAGSPIVEDGLRFLRGTVRDAGSWPIDANLATWVTTLSIDALDAERDLGVDDRRRLLAWLLGQQTKERHPFTHARPGAWGWTDLSGSVPDADDTAGALLALRALDGDGQAGGAAAGIEWLLDLQNGDGGIPTFCRGLGALPFDRSAPDLTAHAIRAWRAWRASVPGPLRGRMDRAERRAVAYLVRTQRSDGSWAPLWFGSQHATGELNLTYGTARVVAALGVDGLRDPEEVRTARDRGLAWLVGAQQPDGGWGGGPGAPASVEETGVALQALAGARDAGGPIEAATARGVAWLIAATDEGRAAPPSPIGLYFARLWYYEELYPLVFALSGLRRATRAQSQHQR